MRLKDKVAIVTGGGSGFGEGIVKKFVHEGAKVLVVDRNGDAARRVAADMGPVAAAHVADVSRADDAAGDARRGRVAIRLARHPGQQRRRVARANADRKRSARKTSTASSRST